MANLVGQFFGDYKVMRMIGRSPFAEVYLAQSGSPRNQSALKVLRVELSEADQEYFIIASRRITELAHPNLIRVTGTGIVQLEESYPVLFMEYAPNGTLRQRHPIGSRLALTTVVPYVRHIAEALHYAHQRELTHGDVRPENILLGSNNQILLSDFSYALISSFRQVEPSTTAYLAPEQIRGQAIPLSDEYALGVMVYEWLSGELPFNGSLAEIAGQHLSAPPLSLHRKVPGITAEIDEVVLTALSKDPGRRFTNLWAFANALEQAAQLAQPSTPFFPGNAGGATGPPTSASDGSAPAAGPASAWGSGAAVSAGHEAGVLPSSPRRLSRRALIAGIPALAIASGGILAWAWVLARGAPAPTSARTTTAQSHALLTYRGHASAVTALAWAPDGTDIASGGDDSTIQVWNAKTGSALLVSRGHAGGVPAVTWSPDSKFIASTSSGPSVSGGPPASNNAVRVLNVAAGKVIYTYQGHNNEVTDVVWSPRGERIVSSSTDYTVQVWDATSGKHALIYRTHPWYVWTVAWSPDAKRLVTGGPDGTIQVWDAVSGHTYLTYRGHANSVEALAWSPDGKLIASGSDDSTARIWDAASGKLVLDYHGHSSYVRDVAWSPDGLFVASGSNDKTVQVWRSATGKPITTYRGHSGAVTAVVWSPAGRAIASGSTDGTVQIWQIA